jgi:hypothetical protein
LKAAKILLLIVFGFLSCRKEGGFKVNGEIASKKSSILEGTESISATSKDDGIFNAELKADSQFVQEVTMDGDSPFYGSSLSFPPGSLGIDTTIQIEEGISVAQSIASEFGLGQAIGGSNTPIAVQSSAGVDAVQPFTIGIAIPSSFGLTINATNLDQLVVVFKAKLHSENRFVGGIIPRREILIENNQAKFTTKYFGVYQLALASVEITERKEAEVLSPVLTKSELQKLPPIAIKSRSAFVVGTGQRLSISGQNFRPTMLLAIAGKKLMICKCSVT